MCMSILLSVLAFGNCAMISMCGLHVHSHIGGQHGFMFVHSAGCGEGG